MKTAVPAMIALAPLFGIALFGGAAAAASEPVADAGEEVILLLEEGDGLVALDSEEMSEASGGFVIQQSSTNQNSSFEDNDITVTNGSQIITGNVLANSANTGGITTAVINSGNNVSVQASTTLNIYLDQ